jgi:hypothetical protein
MWRTTGGIEMSTAMRMVKLVVTCAAFYMCAGSTYAEQTSDPNASKPTTATIELTKLDVNDLALGLSYRVRNDADHDVWVCSDPGVGPFEVFLTQDRQTLLIRKRLNVPANHEWRGGPPAGTYARVKPGGSQAGSLRIDLPVKPNFGYASQGQEEVAQTVRRLALEVGYYDEDLPALVHTIRDIVSQFNFGPRGCLNIDPRIVDTYFPGLSVMPLLDSNKDPYGQGYAYIRYRYPRLIGEKILCADANGISVPYKGRIEEK